METKMKVAMLSEIIFDDSFGIGLRRLFRWASPIPSECIRIILREKMEKISVDGIMKDAP